MLIPTLFSVFIMLVALAVNKVGIMIFAFMIGLGTLLTWLNKIREVVQDASKN